MDSPHILAVIPAHNEEEIIGQTIEDLLNQSVYIGILVVADRCTDNTVSIVKEFEKKTIFVKVIETVDNKDLRAGTINQGIKAIERRIKSIGISPPDAILIMDADTRIDKYAVENAWKVLKSDDSLAAVCSKAGVMPYNGKNIFEWLLYRLQRIEYSMFDENRIETIDNIMIAHGMCTLHRWNALIQIGGIAVSILEDMATTLKYKSLGYKVTVDLTMRAWTEVPLRFKEWWGQRLRWNRGSIDILRLSGVNKVTWPYWQQHILACISLILYHLLPLTFIILMISRGYLLLHGYALLILGISLLFSLYKLKYLEDRNLLDYIIRIFILPELIYGYLQTINLYQGYFYSFTNKKQSW